MNDFNNPFSDLNNPLRAVPEGLRIKVMNDIAIAKALMELEHLLGLNVGSIIERTVEHRNA